MVRTTFAPLLALAVLAASTADATTTAVPRIHPSVHRTLRAQGTVNLMVTLKGGVDAPLGAIKEASFATRGQKIAALVTNLELHAKSAQKSVDAVLAKEALSAGGARFTSQQSFWISNQKVIRGATIELVEQLAGLPDLYEIREEIVVPPPKIQAASTGPTNSTSKASILATEYGVTKIGAPSVWAQGYRGQNVVVGSIDTGVLATHTSIAANYRSSYGWFDPTAKRTTPYDDNGHGTHTIGTIVGNNGLGVAPGAKFISCRACTNTGCSEADLLACAQFMTCPTNAAGTIKDCSQAPWVVSNSWGGGQGDTFFAAAVNAWRAIETIPIFANGNEGPACSTASSPGDYSTVIAVGATDVNDALASFSSKGPSVNGLVKPDISAPGVNVRSAWYTSTTAFNTISGTSMATPHVSGVVALLLSKNPSLTYAQVRSVLLGSTDKSTLKATGYACGGTRDTTFPNNQYGHGRINALTAISRV